MLDVTDEEASLTDGQLRARVAGYAREEPWAPRYVAPELDATHRRLEEVSADATIWRARADAPDTTPDDAAQLRDAAARAEQEAAELAETIAALDEVDDARAAWFTHTATSREKAHRARTELRARGIDPDDPDDRVTAEEWLAAHHDEQADAERTREIHDDYELDQPDTDDRAADLADADRDGQVRVEPAPADIRDTATPDPTEKLHPAARRRVPVTDETTAGVARAQAALAEVAQRQQADAERAAHEAEEEAAAAPTSPAGTTRPATSTSRPRRPSTARTPPTSPSWSGDGGQGTSGRFQRRAAAAAAASTCARTCRQ